tara:strand:+ start:60 stop:248 length:189 start_codon:yes stop_codon:yes gene_type:complete
MCWQGCTEALEHIKRASVINSAGIDSVIFLLNGELKAVSVQSHQWNFSECEIIEVFKAQKQS